MQNTPSNRLSIWFAAHVAHSRPRFLIWESWQAWRVHDWVAPHAIMLNICIPRINLTWRPPPDQQKVILAGKVAGHPVIFSCFPVYHIIELLILKTKGGAYSRLYGKMMMIWYKDDEAETNRGCYLQANALLCALKKNNWSRIYTTLFSTQLNLNS